MSIRTFFANLWPFRRRTGATPASVSAVTPTTASAVTKPDPEEKTYPWIGNLIRFWYIVLQAFIALVVWALGLWSNEHTDTFLFIEWNTGAVITLIQAFHFIRSLRMVDTNELGLITFYGTRVAETDPGLKLIPWGLLFLEKFTVSIQEAQFPDDPEYVQQGDDKEPLQTVTLADGTTRLKVRPIRINSGVPQANASPEEKDSPIGSQQSFVASIVVRYGILRGKGFTFKVNIGSLKEALRQMRDIAENTAKLECSSRTPFLIIKEGSDIDKQLLEELDKVTNSWGIKIEKAMMLSPDLSHGIADKLAGIARAKADAKVTVIEADARKIQLMREGEGAAAAVRANLEAQGEGNKKIMDLMQVDGKAVLAAQTVQSAVGEGDLIVGLDGVKEMMGMVSAAGGRLRKDKVPGSTKKSPGGTASTTPPSSSTP